MCFVKSLHKYVLFQVSAEPQFGEGHRRSFVPSGVMKSTIVVLGWGHKIIRPRRNIKSMQQTRLPYVFFLTLGYLSYTIKQAIFKMALAISIRTWNYVYGGGGECDFGMF